MILKFKRIAALTAALALAASLGAYALAGSGAEEINYMALMISAASQGDVVSGQAAETARNEKIERLNLENRQINFDELYLLAKIIYAEAGSNWLSDEWKLCVGEVVMNRVASPEFPNSVADVIYQPGQYYGGGSWYFNNIKPSERCVGIALRLLEGERYMNDPRVVFQANFRQGSGVHTAFYDNYLGWTYFSLSSRPGLYGT